MILTLTCSWQPLPLDHLVVRAEVVKGPHHPIVRLLKVLVVYFERFFAQLLKLLYGIIDLLLFLILTLFEPLVLFLVSFRYPWVAPLFRLLNFPFFVILLKALPEIALHLS